MRRERYPQTQNRMVYRDRDHREIIMDDHYHGAVYIDDDDFPAWRKYKPRVILGNSSNIQKRTDYKEDIGRGGFYSVDTVNNYISKTPKEMGCLRFGDVYYSEDGYISFNGYDWKKLTNPSHIDYPGRRTVGHYGKYFFVRNDSTNVYYFYDLNYESGPYVIAQKTYDEIGEYLGEIYDEQCQGGLFYQFIGNTININVVSGTDFNIHTIYSLASNPTPRYFQFFYVNRHYFLTYAIQRHQTEYATGRENYYYTIKAVYFDSSSLDNAREIVIVPDHVTGYEVDNNTSRITHYRTQNDYDGNPILNMIHSGTQYFIYIDKYYTYTTWTNYVWRQGRKYITGYGGDSPVYYFTTILYTEDDLSSNWIERTLPQSFKVPFTLTNLSDVVSGRHGLGAIYSTQYSEITFYFDGKKVHNTVFPSDGSLPAEQDPFGATPGAYANSYDGGFFGDHRWGVNITYDKYVVQDYVVNGKIQRTGEVTDGGICLRRPIIAYKDPFVSTNVIFQGDFIFVFESPFIVDGEVKVYMLNCNDAAGIRPDFEITDNIDPISTEDYVFD